MGVTRNELARHLRQCVELGQGALFLEGMRRSEALESVAPGEPSMRPSLPTNVPSSAPPELQVLRDEVLSCTRCRLHRGRTQAVFADGNPSARLVVVGEAPGANEDRTGLPFVGQAGKLLDLMLSSVGLSREESVYICNVIKCRPPGNRDPQPDEISACSSYLRRQLQIVRPEAVLTVGAFASKLLTSTDRALGKLRGEVYSYEGVPVVVTYHPAALLRNRGWSVAAWEDLQLLRSVMDPS